MLNPEENLSLISNDTIDEEEEVLKLFEDYPQLFSQLNYKEGSDPQIEIAKFFQRLSEKEALLDRQLEQMKTIFNSKAFLKKSQSIVPGKAQSPLLLDPCSTEIMSNSPSVRSAISPAHSLQRIEPIKKPKIHRKKKGVQRAGQMERKNSTIKKNKENAPIVVYTKKLPKHAKPRATLHPGYKMYFDYEPNLPQREVRSKSGPTRIFYANGDTKTIYKNGTIVIINSTRNLKITHFSNGDFLQEFPDGATAYRYSIDGTVELKLPDGTQLLQFSNGQREKRTRDGEQYIENERGVFVQIPKM